MKELRMLCAEDEQGRTCWMTALRLFKVVFGFVFFLKDNSGSRIRLALDSLSNRCPPIFLQYGIVLYQNYKIPQQRKTLLSHFSAPVVSLSPS